MFRPRLFDEFCSKLGNELLPYRASRAVAFHQLQASTVYIVRGRLVRIRAFVLRRVLDDAPDCLGKGVQPLLRIDVVQPDRKSVHPLPRGRACEIAINADFLPVRSVQVFGVNRRYAWTLGDPAAPRPFKSPSVQPSHDDGFHFSHLLSEYLRQSLHLDSSRNQFGFDLRVRIITASKVLHGASFLPCRLSGYFSHVHGKANPKSARNTLPHLRHVAATMPSSSLCICFWLQTWLHRKRLSHWIIANLLAASAALSFSSYLHHQ
ncbi:MAG: hypothetical protein E4H01_05750 [Lysobacterales bacterium]|nr:MAG: hypothetical protein E4H01_05750 [Xanthomonadales bacterium]